MRSAVIWSGAYASRRNVLAYAITGREAGPAVHPAVRIGLGVMTTVLVVVTTIGGLAQGDVHSLLMLAFGVAYFVDAHRRDSRATRDLPAR